MKLKLDESGNVIVRNDKPVYETNNGNEIEFDAESTTNTIQNLTRERDGLKATNKTMADGAEKFKDLDLEQITKDRTIVKNLDDKKLIDAGEVDKVKAELSNVFNVEKRKLEDMLGSKDAKINDLMIGSLFAQSNYLKENIILPSDMCRDSFGKNFKIEDVSGKLTVVGYVGDNKIYSQKNSGELAGFEESIEAIVGGYEMKDRILKSSNNGGSGSGSGGSNNKQKIKGNLGGNRQERAAAIASRFPDLSN